ncbi:MAG: hypothetical protein HQL03_15255 [Nitrospirae bacterium]|nr:hypothetical protein [Nitrospirota bacterium]
MIVETAIQKRKTTKEELIEVEHKIYQASILLAEVYGLLYDRIMVKDMKEAEDVIPSIIQYRERLAFLNIERNIALERLQQIRLGKRTEIREHHLNCLRGKCI